NDWEGLRHTDGLAVVEDIRQRDLLLIDVVARLERKLFAECEAASEARADSLAVIGNVVRSQRLFGIEVDADTHAIAEEERFGERQLEATSALSVLHGKFGILTLAEQVSFRDAEFGHGAVCG